MTKFLERVYQDFQEEQHNWCELPLSQFVYNELSGKVYGGYDKTHYEQFYLLKYAPLYVSEYTEVYEDFLDRYPYKVLRILSVGVGAGLDYYGLEQALKKHTDIEVEYLGIDLVDWNYRDESIDFEQVDLSDISQNPQVMAFIKEGLDLVIFPKSIVEIPYNVSVGNGYVELCSLLKAHQIVDVWFINSYIKTSNGIIGMEAFGSVLDKLAEDGYSIFDGVDATDCYSSKGGKVNYPMDYKNSWQKDLEEHCRQKCSPEQAKRCSLLQYPMLNKAYIAYSITNLKKVA
ncbi:MAG: hypothetical protein PHD42_02625 [Dysgonamonadaceae bacterium]|nr:hypothetical protein [Dysgonamonadaceae bacterium]